MKKLELRFHHAIPGWCKIIGLEVKAIPECEGGGFMVREEQAKMIVKASEEMAEAEREGPPEIETERTG